MFNRMFLNGYVFLFCYTIVTYVSPKLLSVYLYVQTSKVYHSKSNTKQVPYMLTDIKKINEVFPKNDAYIDATI